MSRVKINTLLHLLIKEQGIRSFGAGNRGTLGQELEVLSATGTLIRLMDLAMATLGRYSFHHLNTGHKSVRLGYLGDALTRFRLAFGIPGLWAPVTLLSFSDCYYLATWTSGRSTERQINLCHGKFFAMGLAGKLSHFSSWLLIQGWYVRRYSVYYEISPEFSRQVANTARTTIRVFTTTAFNYVSLNRSKK